MQPCRPFQDAELRELLPTELVQCRDEGADVSGYETRVKEVLALEPGPERWRAAFELYEALRALPVDAAQQSLEPTEWEALRASCEWVGLSTSAKTTPDRLLGAWLGRAAGCLLGKPVEGWTFEHIGELLDFVGEESIKDYFPPLPEDTPERLRYPEILKPGPCLRGAVDGMARDDDMDYPILGLDLMERKGLGFTTDDVGASWLEHLPYHLTYTAERAAYRNLIQGRPAPESATFWNPYREWIGAQIRGDIFGWVSPGKPGRAAELAYRDARLSHVRNGTYGEMFVAAANAAALIVTDLNEVLDIAIAHVPPGSRFAELIGKCRAWHKEGLSWEDAAKRARDEYGRHNWAHVLPNAALVALALLYGDGDYERTITCAVRGGWDTDCNGATAGAICGAMQGAQRLPKPWVGPLGDTLHSAVAGYDPSSFRDLSARTGRLAES
ncbi:MAG: ADP-ribosylglycohydrolase family protein [Planctomycetota bacterium]